MCACLKCSIYSFLCSSPIAVFCRRPECADIVTDTEPAVIAANEVPLTQSLGALLNVDPSLVYIYNVTNSDGVYTVSTQHIAWRLMVP